MKFGDIKKQGLTDKGLWIIGTLQYGDIEISTIFSTNLKQELDATKTYEVKKIKITKDLKNVYHFSLVF